MKKILTLMTLVGLLSIPIAAMSTNDYTKLDQTQITSTVPAIVDSGGVIAVTDTGQSAVKMQNVALDTGQSAVPIAFAVYYVTDTGQAIPITAAFVDNPVKQTSPAAAVPIQIAGTTSHYPSIAEVAARTQKMSRVPSVAVKSETFQLEQPVAVRRV